MKAIKIKRIEDGLNKWLKAHGFPSHATIAVHPNGYVITIGNTISYENGHHFNAHYEERLKDLVFNHAIQDEFYTAIDQRPIVTPMHISGPGDPLIIEQTRIANDNYMKD